jgi:uncharacterized membrane protein HdeD (DUF308 family)
MKRPAGEIEMSGKRIAPALTGTTARSIAGAAVMILVGLLALFPPFAGGVRASALLGRIIVIGGFAYFAYAFAAPSEEVLVLRMLIAFIYTFGGSYLLVSPELALRPTTFLAAAIVLCESLLELMIFSQVRPLPGSGWILFDGIATLVLAYLIWRSWPSSSTSALGVFIGIKFILSGFTRLMYWVGVPSSRS